MMETLFLIIIIIVIFSLAILKIVKEKKKGAKCIGCPFYDKNDCSKK